jgi:hypothetical protein
MALVSVSQVKTVSEDFTLVLKVHHHLVTDAVRNTTRNEETEIHGNISLDVLSMTNTTLTISGVWNRVRISSQDIRSSAVAYYLFHYLKTVGGLLFPCITFITML